MSLQPIIFLLLFGGVQGLLFTAFLLRRKLYRHGYIFLLCYLGTMLLQLTLKVMSKGWLMENWSVLYSLAHFLPLLYGPFLLLFLQEKLLYKKPDRKAWNHFFPFLGLLVLLTADNLTTLPRPLQLLLYNPYVRFILLMASITWYHSRALWLWKKQLRQPRQPETGAVQDAWIDQFIRSSFLVTGVVVIALYLLYLNYPAGHGYRYGFIALTYFMYWITWSSLKQPVLFSVMQKTSPVLPQQLPALFVHRRIKKYANSTLDEPEKERIAAALKHCMEHDRLYLDPSLSIDQLAGKIKCTRHVLSQVLNECIGRSFNDYINQYRVAEARMLLHAPDRKHLKIASIAYDAGFNSLSTFNDVFKKMAGCTPSQYSKEISVRQRV